MAIQLRRIYQQPGKGEGHRVFIDRLWPRGLKKVQVQLDVWLKEYVEGISASDR